ncbi:hypothetical protein E4656_16900 [Natronospirillum operosum]|uniref:Uncharacterized protein n=1 Tax=Natronospirillum operosum TaxID=2759953 RepID=A0A4Z0W801_9GAMM|nr:hypothetical protein [Natronospirillum operosum]TGG91073.1 hypothetical protein E4656_16900 [Natronospirillum operosum]
MNKRTLIHTLIVVGVAGIVWPLIGWLALYSQYDRLKVTDLVLPSNAIGDSEIRLEPGLTHLRLFPIPAIEMYQANLHVEGLHEPIQLNHATWRARWYSPWTFYWFPERFIVHQGEVILDTDLEQEVAQDDIWALIRFFHKSRDLLIGFQALQIDRLDILLFDPLSEQVVDLTLSGELKKTLGGVELQSFADITGDGWVEHGYLRLNGRWTPAEDLNAPLLMQSLDTHLEISSTTRDYGFYRWSAEAENLRFNPDGETIRADYLVLGSGYSEGTPAAPDQEFGQRTAINELIWRSDTPMWRADSVQHAAAQQPHHEQIRDIRWLLDSERWRIGSSSQTGRTELTWEVNLAGDAPEQIRMQAIQASGRAPSLNRWEGDNAEVTVSLISPQVTQSMTGWASIDSDISQRTLSITGAEFSEQRRQGDTIWLYGDILATPDGIALNDMTGTLRDTPIQVGQSLAEWLDCWGDWSPLLIAVITQCTEPTEGD